MVKRSNKLTARALALLLALLLAGCGQDAASTENDTPVKIAVTVEGDTVTPSGERIDVKRGQAIQFDITADHPGQLHVHSEPAQSFEYEAGSSTFRLTPIELPGVVDVEEEELGKIVVQLEVR